MNQLANVLALAGRREDNAAHGGQVAHISAAEAELLKRMGGASTRNPVTGLPEYWAMGFGPPAVAQAAALGFGAGGAASGGMGPAANAAPMGIFGPPPSRGGRSSSPPPSVAPPPAVTPSPAPSVVPGGPMGFTVAGPASAMGQAVSAAAGDGGMGFVVGPIAQANAQAQAQAVANATPPVKGPPALDGGPYALYSKNVPPDLSQDGGWADFGAHLGIVPMAFQLGKFLLGPVMEGTAPPLAPYAPPPAPPGGSASARPGHPMGLKQTYRPVDPKTKSRVPTALIDAIRNAAVKPPGTIKVSTGPVQVTSPLSQGLANVIASQTGRFSPDVERIRERFFRQLA